MREAADAFGLGSAADRGGRAQIQSDDPNGQPGPGVGRHAPLVRDDLGRRDRQCARSARLDRPSLQRPLQRVLAAGHRAAERYAPGAVHIGLGYVARARARASLQPGVPAIQMARVVGFRHRRAWRHRLPLARCGVPRAATRRGAAARGAAAGTCDVSASEAPAGGGRRAGADGIEPVTWSTSARPPTTPARPPTSATAPTRTSCPTKKTSLAYARRRCA